ncbi:N-acetyltransferase [Novosphingobium sp. ST904]|uniref:N-acetyltransferase n=1 Tax=Novosphingobium sp. ST904 TaxID=1684385 RepID=UPI0006C8701F|nr:N-acetyltransferase [Novosphingobium sp. ST904]KPH67349.1 hypothetical protein ADT71_02490 [Novosphingobium sp. ST904]TCM34329.1 hypothetical protein EDF59_11813 [Novosphingobium sp. ST904]
MLRLSDAIPRDAIRAKIGDFEEKVTANTAAEYIERDPTGMMTTGLYGWDYAVAQQLVDDDQEIGAVYPARPDLFPGFLDKKWGRPFLQDAFATKLYSPIMPDYPFAVIELCQCFPDDLHIADVELSDIRRKLEQPQNGIGARGYHGLGVFGDLLDGVKMVAKERGLSRISLIAASPQAHAVFERHGFKVGDGALSALAYQQLGYSHAMLLKL